MSISAARVLIVEDERLVALDIQQTLNELGYNAFAIASSADEAIARASEACPDIVLMDIRIKGLRDGIETAMLLRQRFGVPVVFLTAHADDATLARAKRTEPYGYLTKPVTAAALTSAIQVSLFRSEMDRKLRERERWFATTLYSIADAVVTVDLKGVVTYLNPAAEGLLGIPAPEALGRPAREVIRLATTDDGESPLDAVLRERQNIVVAETALMSASGDARIVVDSTSMVLDQGELLGAVMVFRDVTEQRRLEKRVEIADRLASLGTMAAGVAHEITNPLAVVSANAAMVLEHLRERQAWSGNATPAQRARMDAEIDAQTDIVEAAQRIARILGDLRTFSRPEPVMSDQTDIFAVIDWAIRATAHELRHRASVAIERGGEPASVNIARGRLEQVLVNLLINAAHAIPSGHAEDNRVVVRVRRASGAVVVEVADTGAGMSPDVIGRVFEPFFTTKEVGEGTGLGLAICHGIVTSAGGKLDVESEVGKGSVFRISLPEVVAAAPSPPADPVPAQTAEPRRARILVLDDEPMMLKVMRAMLAGYEVVCLDDAREALRIMEHDTAFDLIFSDLTMPKMNGMDFYEALLTRAPELARRVVFLTGGAVSERAQDFLRVVDNARLDKPIFPKVLQAFVRERLAMDASGSGAF